MGFLAIREKSIKNLPLRLWWSHRQPYLREGDPHPEWRQGGEIPPTHRSVLVAFLLLLLLQKTKLQWINCFLPTNTSWFSTTTTETPGPPPAPKEKKITNKKLYETRHEEDLKFLWTTSQKTQKTSLKIYGTCMRRRCTKKLLVGGEKRIRTALQKRCFFFSSPSASFFFFLRISVN